MFGRQDEESDRGMDAETDSRTLGGPLAPVMPEMNKVSSLFQEAFCPPQA